ncbi:Imm49 family immunity protein [Streptomyces sp. NBC_00439]|uniref:Imm49 family immunity protein n=1 Tax=Streptomyces sp. NBC_00439 TaxID=2903650 RepID=UPI002255E1D1|nr:Imm49 family immunity protein [Streptomyces sp. NBC_00439]MCX5103954.1 immunity 49 family protein [Streptomyces sp. NBC_00439]
MRDELLDHVAARAAQDPALNDETARAALRTAAECSLGALSVGCFPNGDEEILFPLIDEQLSSENIAFNDVIEQAPTAETWLTTFTTSLISGLMRDRQRGVGLLLRSDYAPAIREGVPYSTLTSTSQPADLAAMDALCEYLTEASGHLPRDWPAVPLRKPDPVERAEAARRLDAAGHLTPDQQLLRVLLDDDQPTFERALVTRLVEHRDSVGADLSPRTLLPVGVAAVAALAVQLHEWELGVLSGYLPSALLGSPVALQ